MDSLIVSGEEAVFVLIRGGILIFIFLYVVFAALVIKQVRLMTETIDVGFDTQIKILAFLHFAIALISLITAFVII